MTTLYEAFLNTWWVPWLIPLLFFLLALGYLLWAWLGPWLPRDDDPEWRAWMDAQQKERGRQAEWRRKMKEGGR